MVLMCVAHQTKKENALGGKSAEEITRLHPFELAIISHNIHLEPLHFCAWEFIIISSHLIFPQLSLMN